MKESTVLKNILERRRSIYPRDYSVAEVPQEMLDSVLAAAATAPSHKKTKPWRFRVFTGDEKKALAAACQQAYRSTTAPPHFLQKKYEDIANKILASGTVISISTNFSGLVPEWEEVAATAMAVQNMYLMCTAEGLGCYWSTPGFASQLSEFLSLSENQKPLGLFYVGMLKN